MSQESERTFQTLSDVTRIPGRRLQTVELAGFLAREDTNEIYIADPQGTWVVLRSDALFIEDWNGDCATQSMRALGRPIRVGIRDGATIHEIRPWYTDVPVTSSGRWGRRRARVSQCAAILAAELVYDRMVCDGSTFGPGSQAMLSWTPQPGSGQSWDIRAELLPNAVWRRGRLFLRCPHCEQRATRLYVPIAALEPRCRRCWGLSYESQSWSYKATGAFAFLGPLAYATTLERKKERKRASRDRYDARRALL